MSTYLSTGTGGTPYNPDNFLPASNTGWYDSLNVPQSEATVKEPLPTASVQLVEAQGWQQNPDGTIVLTAESTGDIPSSSLAKNGCAQNSATATNTDSKSHILK